MKRFKFTTESVAGSRFYKFDDIQIPPVPSVTSVLSVISKPALIHWEKKMALDHVKKSFLERNPNQLDQDWITNVIKEARGAGQDYLEKAQVIGIEAHNVLEGMVKNERVFVKDSIRPIVMGFQRFAKTDPTLQFIDAEIVVVSKQFGYAGCVDAIGERITSDGIKKKIIFDWKTSNRTYEEYSLQLAAYAKAFEELYGEKVDEAWLVRFSKDKPIFQAKQVLDLEHSFHLFKCALDLYNGTMNQQQSLFFSLSKTKKKAKSSKSSSVDSGIESTEEEDIDDVEENEENEEKEIQNNHSNNIKSEDQQSNRNLNGNKTAVKIPITQS